MKTALIFGSSGLVGKNLLNQIINNSNYSKVKIFVRSSLEISDPKVEIINTDFKDLQKIKNLITGDDCFFCIGTTKKNSPDKNEYRRIELDLPKKIAQISKSNGIRSFIYVSSGFADPKNSGDYLKFKGLVEEEIKSLNFEKIGILRPSFLLGKRKQFRIFETIGIYIFRLSSPFFYRHSKKNEANSC